MAGYDTIIVGAGSAGCVLAGRLSEDVGRRVLVLEAGGQDWNPLIHIPLGVGKIWSNPRYNWDYHGEPEPNVDGRSIYHPRGKVVGGSSSINIMAYVRCNRFDFDRLPQMGLKGWSYADVLPYFKRAERFDGGADAYRGGSGPLKTRRNPAGDAVFDAFLGAAPELGYRANPDYNGATQDGFSKMQHTIGDGRRCSAAVAYLHPALKRSRELRLETRAHATRILFEGTRAVGVEYLKNGERREARAPEVILSGGAYNSPQLLMVSGIGPADELRDKGIAVRVDSPGVGKNLWDHPSLSTLHARTDASPFLDKLRMDRLGIAMLQAWFLRTGFATRLPSNGTAFIRSTPDVEAPDIQAYCGSGGYASKEWFPVIRKRGPDVISLLFCHVREHSRGEVTLASADPLAKARIFNNFLSTDYDRRAMREGFKFCAAIAASKPFQGLAGPRFLPGPDVKTDAEIDAFVRRAMITIYHPAGTCKIGTDAMAVVDPEFRVRGTEGLRVVDASLWPFPLGGNINAPTIMMAEKASDTIRGRAPLAPAEV
jgi:choline dehydrogenase-like flavoprotein